jgi:hypothetical protein
MVFTGTDGHTRTLPIRDIRVDMITHTGVVILDKLYEDWSHSFPIEPPTEEQPSMVYNGKVLILTGVTLTYELYEGTHPSKEKLYIGCNREGYKYHEDNPQAHDDWEFEATSGPSPIKVTRRRLYPNMLPMQPPVEEFNNDTWYETFTNQGEDVSIDNVIIDPRDMNEVATGLNTRVYLFGNKVDTHYIRVEYMEGYGPICTISFLANKVSMALDRVEERVLYPIPNTARHIIQGYTHMGERIPQYFDVIDCQWGDNNEEGYEH